MEGFRKGKIPKRFENMSDKEIMELPHLMCEEISCSIVDDITHKINVYYDTELSAMQTIIKIKHLEKALDKAIGELMLWVDDWEEVKSTWSVEEWKEWCMKDEKESNIE